MTDDADGPTEDDQARLRKLRVFMAERGFRRHRGGFWLTPDLKTVLPQAVVEDGEE